MSMAFGPRGRWALADAEGAVEFFAGSAALGVLGWDFQSQPALLDSTETEKAMAVVNATTAINSVAVLLVLVILG
jgi:hypothetical protein